MSAIVLLGILVHKEREMVIGARSHICCAMVHAWEACLYHQSNIDTESILYRSVRQCGNAIVL